jgi:hypothetical protein
MQTILVLTWFILFDDFSIGQKILNELAGYSKCQPCACTCTPLQHNADDFSIFKIIYGAPAGTWPRPFIDQYPLWSSAFYNIRISSDLSCRSDGDRSAERKSSKSDGRTLWLYRYFEHNGHNLLERGSKSTHSEIKLFRPDASIKEESKKLDFQIGGAEFPAACGKIQSRQWARLCSFWIINSIENMICGQEPFIGGYEEGASLNRSHLPRFIWIDGYANDGNSGALYLVNCRDKPDIGTSHATIDHEEIRRQSGDEEFIHDPPVVGIGVVRNDGSFTGNCIVKNTRGARDYLCPDQFKLYQIGY